MSAATLIMRRILVVDDEPLICQGIGMVLRADHHEAVVVNTGLAALTELAKNPADLVLIDYFMPDMRGDALARLIKEQDSSQPVVMITAYAEVLKFSHTPLDAVDCLLSKPFSIDDLRAIIAKYARPFCPATVNPALLAAADETLQRATSVPRDERGGVAGSV
jgi:CheY-like chemotaxis protein